MKTLKKVMSVVLATAVVMTAVVTSVGAYTVTDKVDSTNSGVKTTNASGTTYVFDFKDNSGNVPSITLYRTTTAATAPQSISADGYSLKSGTGVSDLNKLNQWLHDIYLADPDFVLGPSNAYNATVLEAGHYYEVKVTWQCDTAEKGIALVRSCSPYTEDKNYDSSKAKYGLASESVRITDPATCTKANTTTVSTFVVDGDSMIGTNAAKGCYLGLAVHQNATVIFKSVEVTVYDKEAFTAPDKQLTVNFDNGLKDIFLPSGDGNNYGKIEIAKDPNNSGRGNALKLTGTRVDGTTFLFGLPVKPGLGNYNGSNALSEADGYKVTLGNTYNVSFDIYCEDVDEGICSSGIACYLANINGVGKSNNKKSQDKTRWSGDTVQNVEKKAGDGNWCHFEFTFTATSPDTSYTYLLIGFATTAGNTNKTKDYSAITWFDNIVVTDVTNSADKYVSNAKRSIRAESGTGADYISAGIRFRGEIATATADAAEEVGFIVAPEQYVTAYTGTTVWYDMSAGKPALETAQTVDTTNVIYGTNGNNNQYQLLLRGLTQQNATVDLKDTYFTVMMYLKDSEGNYTYYNVATLLTERS